MDTLIVPRAARIPREVVYRHGAGKIVYAADNLLERIEVDFTTSSKRQKELEAHLETFKEGGPVTPEAPASLYR